MMSGCSLVISEHNPKAELYCVEPEYYDETSPYWGNAIEDPLTGWVQNSDLVQPDMEWCFMKFEGIPLGNPTYTINSTDGWAAASGAWNWQNTKTKMN